MYFVLFIFHLATCRYNFWENTENDESESPFTLGKHRLLCWLWVASVGIHSCIIWHCSSVTSSASDQLWLKTWRANFKPFSVSVWLRALQLRMLACYVSFKLWKCIKSNSWSLETQNTLRRLCRVCRKLTFQITPSVPTRGAGRQDPTYHRSFVRCWRYLTVMWVKHWSFQGSRLPAILHTWTN